MKKLAIILILLVIGGGGAYYYYAYGKPKEKPQVVQAAVSRGSVTEMVSATGTLQPVRTQNVGSQVSGVVSWVGPEFNSIVKAGEVIAKLDPSLLQVQVEIQKAAKEQRLTDIENQKVSLADAETNLKRQKDLIARGLTTQQAVEQAELTVKQRQASIKNAQSQLISQQASLDQAELNVKYTTIVSPIDGVVVNRLVEVGQTVQSSVNVAQFFVIATDLTKLKLNAGVDEAEIGKVRTGQEVTFTVDSYPNQTFYGKVSIVGLNAATANNVVMYPVWIDVPNNDLKLRPSLTASAKIIISRADDVLRVPSAALRFRPNTEIYKALGVPAPEAGNARAGRGGPGDPVASNGAPVAAPGGAPQATPGPAAAATPGATPAPGVQGPSRQPGGGQGGQNARTGQNSGQGGQNRQGANRTPGGTGQGFGRQSNMSDEERARMMAQFRAGRGGGGRGGAGGGQNQGGRGGGGRGGAGRQPANAAGDTTPLTQRNAEKIDELFLPLRKQEVPGQVWTWDEAKKELKSISVRTGISEGQFSELVWSAVELQVGQQLVTGVMLPQPKPVVGGQPNPFGGQPQRGMPGMTPGGGGNPGGGGGGRGGGGGGGGRGGN